MPANNFKISSLQREKKPPERSGKKNYSTRLVHRVSEPTENTTPHLREARAPPRIGVKKKKKKKRTKKPHHFRTKKTSSKKKTR